MALNEKSGHTSFYPYNYNQNDQQAESRRMPKTQSSYHRTQSPPLPQYKWEMSEWSECNRLCNGETFRMATCVQDSDGRKVLPSQCRPPKPDDEYRTCNTECDIAYVFWKFNDATYPTTGSIQF